MSYRGGKKKRAIVWFSCCLAAGGTSYWLWKRPDYICTARGGVLHLSCTPIERDVFYFIMPLLIYAFVFWLLRTIWHMPRSFTDLQIVELRSFKPPSEAVKRAYKDGGKAAAIYAYRRENPQINLLEATERIELYVRDHYA